MGVDIASVAKSGLNSSKRALETTTHNIANVNTPGYSRQQVHQSTNPPIGVGHNVLGTGSYVNSVNRVHDKFLEKKVNQAMSEESYYRELSEKIGHIEDIFNELENVGLSKLVSEFFNAFRELSNRPESETFRSIVREKARIVINDFQRIFNRVSEVVENINHELDSSVADINTHLHGIARINGKIKALENLHGSETGDLRDERDRLIRDLADYFAIHVYEDSKGHYTVAAKGVGTLVNETNYLTFETGAPPRDKDKDLNPFAKELFFTDKPSVIIGHKFKNGKIRALHDIRKNNIEPLQAQMHEIAFNLIESVNAIHRKGYINLRLPPEVAKDPNIKEYLGRKLTGINFFEPVHNKFKAGEEIRISKEVREDLLNIATAFNHSAPGDNRISNAVSRLQYVKFLDNGASTLDEKYLKSIANIGLHAGKFKIQKEQAEGILAQIKTVKERMSGVSLDEETANMVRFQRAFNSSAKVLKTSEEVFNALLEIV